MARRAGASPCGYPRNCVDGRAPRGGRAVCLPGAGQRRELLCYRSSSGGARTPAGGRTYGIYPIDCGTPPWHGRCDIDAWGTLRRHGCRSVRLQGAAPTVRAQYPPDVRPVSGPRSLWAGTAAGVGVFVHAQAGIPTDRRFRRARGTSHLLSITLMHRYKFAPMRSWNWRGSRRRILGAHRADHVSHSGTWQTRVPSCRSVGLTLFGLSGGGDRRLRALL